MTIPNTFATFPAGSFPAADWDQNWSFVAALSNIYCTCGGTANVITLTPTSTSPAVTALQTGMVFTFIASNTNTGTTTIQVSGLNVLNVYTSSAVLAVAGQIVAGTYYAVVYDASLNGGNGGFRIGSVPSSTAQLQFNMTNSGLVLTPGVVYYVPPLPFAGALTSVSMLGDVSGSIVVDIWRCTYTQFDAGSTHPVVADSITGATPPTITTATKMQDNSLVGWTTQLNANDVLALNINSVSSFARVSMGLTLSRVA